MKVAKAEAKAERAEAKAEKRAKESIAQRLLKLGEITLETIAECTGLTLRQVRALARNTR